MCSTAGPLRRAGISLASVLVVVVVAASEAQVSTGGFITGKAGQAWEQWQAALQAVLERNADQAERVFGQLLAEEPSPLRVALLADYTVNRTASGGALLMFEQDMEADALGPNGQEIAARLTAGREQMNEADDGWYFCQIGRFDVAEANFRALLAASPDPVALLEFADRAPKRREMLVQLMDNAVVGDSARALLKLLERGEAEVKADPLRIKENVERLGGPPRGFENAREALRDSGEYAVPYLLQALRDPTQKPLLRPILRCLPEVDRPGLNPLVMALRMKDDTTKRYVIEALTKIGYAQAVPYLLQLAEDRDTPGEIKQSATAALDALQAHGGAGPSGLTASAAFFQLAEDYHTDKPSLAADVRLDTANIWYWREEALQNTEVPTTVFNEIMCMRCCEEALRLDPNHKGALALWLAANLRREAQLPAGQVDSTRPAKYPPAAYFAQCAGPEYCLLALARAIDRNEPAVALGAIEALRQTAGPASLVADSCGRLPLAEALSCPDRMVRIQAALTLGLGRPTQPFSNHQNLMPVLSEALMLERGARHALVIDPDAASGNVVAAALRGQGYEVLTAAALFPGLTKVREQVPGLDVICIASDIRDPGLNDGLAALRGEFRFAAIPVVLVAKTGDVGAVRELVKADARLAELPQNPTAADVSRAIATVSKAIGATTITPEIGRGLAREATEVLRLLALTNNPLFDISAAETALLTAFGTADAELRLAVAEVLGYLGSSKTQEAIAAVALSTKEPEDLRVKMFTALAEAAKRRGNLLGAAALQQVVTNAESDANMTIREAASRTLGALNVPGAPASQIIRNQYGG
jgi:CheY-like chemotaxis protein